MSIVNMKSDVLKFLGCFHYLYLFQSQGHYPTFKNVELC